jgi:hypothetical protein
MKSAAQRITDLREEGYHIKVKQLRQLADEFGSYGFFPKHEIRELRKKKDSLALSPRGGKTVITITTPGGTTVEGVARCRCDDPARTTPGDVFNKKVGLSIALGRALKQLPIQKEVPKAIEAPSKALPVSVNGNGSTSEFNLTGHGSDGTAQ